MGTGEFTAAIPPPAAPCPPPYAHWYLRDGLPPCPCQRDPKQHPVEPSPSHRRRWRWGGLPLMNVQKGVNKGVSAPPQPPASVTAPSPARSHPGTPRFGECFEPRQTKPAGKRELGQFPQFQGLGGTGQPGQWGPPRFAACGDDALPATELGGTGVLWG